MRYSWNRFLTLPIALALPALGHAHTAPHDTMAPLAAMAHFLGEHYPLGVIAGLAVVVLMAASRRAGTHQANRDGRGDRR